MGPIVILATGAGLILSLLTLPSCHWVRIRGREETNRNLGIWRKANLDDYGRGYGICTAYGGILEVDSELKLARASTIIAPIFAGISLLGNLMPGIANIPIAETPLGKGMSLMGAIVAMIFQALTLTVHVSEACHISQGSFCSVGFTTWAYWVSLVAALCFLAAAAIAFVHNATEKGKEKDPSPETAAAAAAVPAEAPATVPVATIDTSEP